MGRNLEYFVALDTATIADADIQVDADERLVDTNGNPLEIGTIQPGPGVQWGIETEGVDRVDGSLSDTGDLRCINGQIHVRLDGSSDDVAVTLTSESQRRRVDTVGGGTKNGSLASDSNGKLINRYPVTIDEEKTFVDNELQVGYGGDIDWIYWGEYTEDTLEGDFTYTHDLLSIVEPLTIDDINEAKYILEAETGVLSEDGHFEEGELTVNGSTSSATSTSEHGTYFYSATFEYTLSTPTETVDIATHGLFEDVVGGTEELDDGPVGNFTITAQVSGDGFATSQVTLY